MKKKLYVAAILFLNAAASFAADFVWGDSDSGVCYSVSGKVSPVVEQAISMFRDDIRQVVGCLPEAVRSDKATISIVQLDKATVSVKKALMSAGVPVDELAGRKDGFSLSVSGGKVYVVGNNGRGTAYGLLELSRKAGVSPWIWWGDVVPEKKSRLVIADGFNTLQSPSVEYRGVFLNDEDWTLRPWSTYNYEPGGRFWNIGPKTNKRVFQLLLRLRANAVWPAMHTGTPGFFTIPGNREMADSFDIAGGTSHCEPLLRNNVAEWNTAERGRYNYITNRKAVQDYWIERLREVKGSEKLYTIGMRGIHDGSMEGVKTMKEKTEALQQVIDDQREMLGKHIDKDVESIPQVFVPYKEVLQIMENGLRVPDDVTLMWCDDNYGYLTRLSDEEQQKRKGGAGVYYHLSYWGRPHDYLWLTTTQPGLVYCEMRQAYDHNARKLWIVNVHDPKVAAYDLSLFLDMAWDIDCVSPSTLQEHLKNWLAEQFGANAATALLPAMTEFYRLCGIRKPEHMGWTQVELDKKTYPRGRSQVTDTEFGATAFGDEQERYLADYAAVCRTVNEVEKTIRPELLDAYFAAVKYPVLSASAMAVKMIEAQRARAPYLGQTDRTMLDRETKVSVHAARSMGAYQEIQRLTEHYNATMSGGKWKGSMNSAPRDLYVFFPPLLPFMPEAAVAPDYTSYVSMPYSDMDGVVVRNACDYRSASSGVVPTQMLGHSMNAVQLPKEASLTYEFEWPFESEATLYTALIPTQPNDRGDLRYSVSIDGGTPVVISLKEPFRSEKWKKNVMRGQALNTTKVKLTKGRHTLTVKALDNHVVIDQWMIDSKPNRPFYVLPVRPAL